MAPSSTPLVVWAIDVKGWCFENIAKIVSMHLADGFRFKIQQHNTIVNETCDILVSMWWGNTARLNSVCNAERIMGMIYDGLSWKVNPDSKHMMSLNLNSMDAVGICNKPFACDFEEQFSITPKIHILEDGVNTELFKGGGAPPAEFCVGWVGNSNRCTPGGPKDQKGLAFIRKICGSAGVKLKVLDAAKGVSWPHSRMPEFYNQVSAVIIGSAFEGTPNPLLEGLASGKPVITTPVGLAPDIIQEGWNGWFINREDPTIAIDKLKSIKRLGHDQLLKMGEQATASVLPYSWEFKAQTWREAFHTILDGPSSRLNRPQRYYDTNGVSVKGRIDPIARNGGINAPCDLACVGDQFRMAETEKNQRDNAYRAIKTIENEIDTISAGRPIIYVLGLLRFHSRTLKLLKYLVKDYEFIPFGWGAQSEGEPKPDLIWTLYPYREGIAAMELKHRYKVPMVATARGEFWHGNNVLSKETIGLAEKCYLKADAVVTLSDTCIRNMLQRCIDYKRDRFYKIPNGGFAEEANKKLASCKPLDIPSDLPRPWLGTLTNWIFSGKARGTNELASAINAMKEFTGTLIIGGNPGPFVLPEGHIYKHVFNMGEVHDVWSFYKDIDAYMHHSYQDSQPSVIMEALSAKKLVLTTINTKTGTHEFIKHNITGIKHPNIKKCIELWLNMPEDERVQIANNGYGSIINEYTWESAAQAYSNIFKSFFNQPRV